MTHANLQPGVDNGEPHGTVDENAISELITGLASANWSERRNAEDGLRELGSVAVPHLLEALASSSEQMRWGAIKVLSDLANPVAIQALVEALEDEDGGIRWLAAQGLIKTGYSSVIPLLRRLLSRADFPWMQEGAHHVLRGLADPKISPVIVALAGRFPEYSVPVAASEALKKIESGS